MTPNRPSRTAEAVCYMRATELARPAEDRVVDDPFAPAFLGALARTQLKTGVIPLPLLTTYIVCRHRYMDDRWTAADVDQYVVLGAGYDMRARRFPSDRPVFEVDFPATAARKARLVRGLALPKVDVRSVLIDFQTERLEDKLIAAGFRPGVPTFFVWEGVSMYLRREAVKGTLATLRALGGPGSELVMDYWEYLDRPDFVATAHRMSAGLLHLLGEPITFALHAEEGPDFLARNGWEALDTADAATLERRYLHDGRKVYPANWVVHARRG